MADASDMSDTKGQSGGSAVKATRGRRRTKVGVVTSDKRDKTIRVLCRFVVKHAAYGKYMNRRTVIHAHDEKNEAAVGDQVQVMECRPMSKSKNWRLVRIVQRA